MMWKFSDFGDKVAAISDDDQIVTYKDLDASALVMTGYINKRCLVFSFCTNSLGSLLGYTGFINHRIVPLLLDSTLNQEFVELLIEKYKPSYLWLPEPVATTYSMFEIVYEIFGFVLLKTNFEDTFDLFEDLALLLTTSGSTGSPKLVRISYNNIEANTKSIVEYLKLNSLERPITTLPMNYTYGLSIINTHLYVGATLLLTDKTLVDKSFWTFLKEKEATSFGGVPYTYEILDKLRFHRMELPYLKTMTQAGGRLSPELHKKYAEFAFQTGKQFVVMYGQTEATARMSYLPVERTIEKYGSVGIAIPGGKFYLIDIEDAMVTEPHVVGELVYEGGNVTLGYAETGKDLSLGDERMGKLITGDMARFDEDGYYYIVGRKKRFLKIFGSRVNLDEIESLINDRFNEVECACTGVDDLMVVYVTNSDLVDDVRKFIMDKTGINKSALRVNVILEIPRNESGKTLYSGLEI